jgi:hypothetical protein
MGRDRLQRFLLFRHAKTFTTFIAWSEETGAKFNFGGAATGFSVWQIESR